MTELSNERTGEPAPQPRVGGKPCAEPEPDLLCADRLEALLYKYTNVMKGWQYRWFVVDARRGVLEYYMPDDKKKSNPRGCIQLAGCFIAPSEDDSQTFTVSAACGEVYKLKASDARQRQFWVNKLRQVGHNQDRRASIGAVSTGHLNDVRESLLLTQKTQVKLAGAIEAFTQSDEQLLILKATSHSSLMALEQCFTILQTMNDTQTLKRKG